MSVGGELQVMSIGGRFHSLRTTRELTAAERLRSMLNRSDPRVRMLRVRSVETLIDLGIHPSEIVTRPGERGETLRFYEWTPVRLNGYLNEGDVLVEWTDGRHTLIPCRAANHES